MILDLAPEADGHFRLPKTTASPLVRVFSDPIHGVLGRPLVFDRAGCRTLADVIARVPLDNEAVRPHLRVRMGGELIDPALYHRVLPKADTYLTVVLPLHGGDNNLLLTIASVALVAGAALVSGGALVPLLGSGFAAGTIGANLAAAGLSLAGSLLLQGLEAKPTATQSGETETIGSASAQNSFGPGAYLIRVMGARRVAPQMVMPPYTEIDGKDQIVTVVYGLAGPHAISDIRIGDAPIEDAADIDYEVREGFADDGALTLVTDTRIEHNVNLTLSEFRMVTEGEDRDKVDTSLSDYAPYWHRVQTKSAPDRIKLLFALPQGLAWISDEARSGITSMRVRMRRRGDTDWINLPEFILKAKAPGIPIRLQMELNFVASGAMPGSHNSPPTPSFTDGPRGWYQWHNRWPVTGTVRWQASSYFTTYTHAVNFVDSQKIELFLATSVFTNDTAWELEFKRGFVGKHKSGDGYSATLAEYIVPFDDYADFYSTRTDPADGYQQIPLDPDDAPGRIDLVSVQSVWDEYPFDLTGQPTALLAIRARNRSLQNVSVLAEGYTEDWNGSTWVADQLTRNPASWYRETLRSELNAEPVPDSLIDGPALVDWHEWNDSEGHVLSLVVQGQPVDEVLSSIAQAGFARPLYGVKHGVIPDRPRAQVGLVTMRNAAGFSFEKPFGRLSHALKVQLTDEASDYEVRELIVYADGYAAAAGGGLLEATRFESVTYPGITSEALATQRARRDMRWARHRSRLISFTQDIEHLEFNLGDRVGVHTDILGQMGGRGRVKAVLTGGGLVTGLQLDEARDFTKADADGADRGVQMRLADGTLLNKKVTSDDSDLTQVVFSTPFAMPSDEAGNLIGPGTLVATGALNRETLPVIIWEMTPGPDLTCSVVAIPYAEEEVYRTFARSVAFSGAGTLAVAPKRIRNRSVAFAGAGSLSVAPLKVKLGAVAFSGSGTLAVTPERIRSRSAAFSGSGTLAVAPKRIRNRSVAFAGAGSLAVAPLKVKLGAVAFSGSGALAVAPKRIRNRSVAFSGAGTLAVAPTVRDAHFASVALLLHADGTDGSTTFTDHSANGLTVTPAGNVQIDTAQSKFGGASALFDGSGDALTVAANAALGFGTGNFTVEMWVRFNAAPPNNLTLFDGNTNGSMSIFRSSGSSWQVARSGIASDHNFTWNPSTGVWYHLAVTRAAGIVRVFVDGVLNSTSGTVSSNYGQNGTRLGGFSSAFLNGWLDDIRVTKGVARYTANFNLPPRAFPNA